MHIRGPMNISQLAVYMLSSSTTKPKKRHSQKRRHGAGMARQESSTISDDPLAEFTTVAVSAREETIPVPSPNVAAAAAWNRVAYYTSSTPAQASGLAFMANLGYEGCSGTFDTYVLLLLLSSPI
jgi:hypothetical protein